jgi:hypothetical protein
MPSSGDFFRNSLFVMTKPKPSFGTTCSYEINMHSSTNSCAQRMSPSEDSGGIYVITHSAKNKVGIEVLNPAEANTLSSVLVLHKSKSNKTSVHLNFLS